MSGAPPDVVLTQDQTGTTYHSLPASNPAGTTDSVALPFQGVTGGVPVPVSGTFWQTTQPISGNVGVSGSVAVTGTFWQATQPVSFSSNVAVYVVTGAPAATLTRPANTTAYAAGTLVASSTTAGSVVVPSFTVPTDAPVISALRLSTNVTTGWSGVAITITLWSAAPTYSNGDGGVYAVATGMSHFLGQYQVSLIQGGDGAAGRAGVMAGPGLVLPLSVTTVYWDMEIFNAATPISGQTFTLTAECHG